MLRDLPEVAMSRRYLRRHPRCVGESAGGPEDAQRSAQTEAGCVFAPEGTPGSPSSHRRILEAAMRLGGVLDIANDSSRGRTGRGPSKYLPKCPEAPLPSSQDSFLPLVAPPVAFRRLDASWGQP